MRNRWVLALLCCCATVAADERSAVYGRWANEKSIIEVSPHGGTLRATVVTLTEPVYREGEQLGPIGALRRDDRNPRERLRGRTVVGMDLIEGYRFEDERWRGRIYDPESGNTYSSRMWVDDQGRLNMRGYIGLPILGRTAIFLPLTGCEPHVVQMLATLGHADRAVCS